MSASALNVFATAGEHGEALAAGRYTAEELARACLEQAELHHDLNVFTHLDPGHILKQARESDHRRARGESLGPLDGIPVSIKDNICEAESPTTCASRILENFVAPYDATVVERLRAAGAVLFGRTNMDEFAMGSSTENSSVGATRNPWNRERVPGGSSGGSAAAVAAGITPIALGSDTGGSIRQPAAFCGIYGLKPTYGRVSRYGLVAYASSLDQIGPMARSVADCAMTLAIISGPDARDSTSHPDSVSHPVAKQVQALSEDDLRGLRVGYMAPPPGTAGYDDDVLAASGRARQWLQDRGAQIIDFKSAYEEYLIPVYYILATAEASSNLSRYDGIRYGNRVADASGLKELYVRTRTRGFGEEVKRRILLGTFVLSSGYYDAYYKSAQKARALLHEEYREFFEKVDVILQPTSPVTAFRLGERTADPLAMYQSDILTIGANLAGLPAMSFPAGRDRHGLPIGLQVLAPHFSENLIFEVVAALSRAPEFHPDYRNVSSAAPKKSSAQKSSAKKSSAQKSSAKESNAKESNAKKSAAQKSSAKKSSAQKSSAQKSSAQKSTAKKSTAKKSKPRKRR
ncbi:MAG: Asp-tRNA(Asn)/Glu-tRNA(Gln) amidotransferase subunit GatA [Leptospiraceae bacterium]|nr:Asp-tRNA(Asn)/Glu-tRNA(Gln) amidotransferase subunit GatA [Leptospiraceae bacterium]